MRNTSTRFHGTLLVALLACPALTGAQTATAAAPDDHATRIKRIENGLRPLQPEVMIKGDPTWTLEERMAHYGVPGVGIAVIHEGRVAWHRTYGVTDRETGAPIKTDTLFQAGSVSKPVAAFGAMKLVQDGKLTLDGNVNETLKSWKLPDNEFTKKKKVNLSHLLSHTGGLTVHGFPGYAVGTPVPSLVQVLDGSGPANTPPIRVDKEPGGASRYSGGGFTVAQQLMIDVSGKPFPNLMQGLVLGPLGMIHSTYQNPLPPSLRKHAAAGYLPDKSPVAGKRHTYPEMAAAGLWTTAEDLARFAVEVQQALRGKGKLLTEATARKMVEKVDRGVGRGFMIGERMQHVYFSHGGWDEGFCANLTAHRDDGYGVAVMINSNHPRFISEVVRAVAEEYRWGGYHAYEKTAIPDKMLETCPGRYRFSAEQMFTIERRANRLFMKYAGWKPMELVHVGDGRFVRRERPSLITFTETEGRTVLHFAFDDGTTRKHAQLPEDELALRELVLFEPYEQALAAYRAALKANPKEESLAERELNFWGLSMLEEGEVDGAIALLKINTELYPDSANTYDSVGFVYRKVHQDGSAMTWYRKALDVDPNFTSAARAVVELQAERATGVGVVTCGEESGKNKVTIRALIDGSDVVKIRGDTLWYEHIAHVLPGAWAGHHDDSGNEPTVVNGVEWRPQWNGRISTKHTAEQGLLPADTAVCVTAYAVNARGRVVLLEQPSEENDYTLSMLLDDDRQIGATWYEVQLRWLAPPGVVSAQRATDNPEHLPSHSSPTTATRLSGSTEQEIHEATQESAPPRLPDEFGVRSILEDSKGNFWFGSWRSGAARFDGHKLTIFTTADGLDRNQVRDIYEDAHGRIWFNTGNGICSYDGNTIINHTTDRNYNAKDDWKLAARDLWFGEDDGRGGNELEGQPGVYRHDGKQLSFLAFPLPKIRGTDWEYKSTGIARGKGGRIWFATYGSVIGYDGRSFTFMNNQTGRFDGSTETDLHVRSIFEDSKGRLWIGNNGIGVLLQEGGKTINFTQKHGLGSQENRPGGPLPGDAPAGSPSLDRVFAIGEDSAGNIWFGLVGKQGHGAWRYDGTTLRHYTEKDGLASKSITAIYRDKRGDLWLGGDGVFKFNGTSFNRIH